VASQYDKIIFAEVVVYFLYILLCALFIEGKVVYISLIIIFDSSQDVLVHKCSRIYHTRSWVVARQAFDVAILAAERNTLSIVSYISNLLAGVEWDENGNGERWLYTRKTPTIMAGSRFKYLAPKIKFGYNELVNAISDAIEKSEKLDGAKVVDTIEVKPEEKLNYNDLRAEARSLWGKLVGEGDNLNEEMAARIQKRVEIIFGRPIKLSEITEDQVDLLHLVVLDMKELETGL
jgi:hypothetical protein